MQILIETWRGRVLLLSTVFGFALSGCITDAEMDPADAVQSAPVTQIAAAPKTDPVVATTEPPPVEPEPEPLLPVPDPASLVGYNEAALETLLGTPSFTRRDPPAALWQYRNDRCTLDLFLYEGASGDYSVEHLEFRETAASTEATEHCLRAIIELKLAATSTF